MIQQIRPIRREWFFYITYFFTWVWSHSYGGGVCCQPPLASESKQQFGESNRQRATRHCFFFFTYHLRHCRPRHHNFNILCCIPCIRALTIAFSISRFRLRLPKLFNRRNRTAEEPPGIENNWWGVVPSRAQSLDHQACACTRALTTPSFFFCTCAYAQGGSGPTLSEESC